MPLVSPTEGVLLKSTNSLPEPTYHGLASRESRPAHDSHSTRVTKGLARNDQHPATPNHASRESRPAHDSHSTRVTKGLARNEHGPYMPTARDQQSVKQYRQPRGLITRSTNSLRLTRHTHESLAPKTRSPGFQGNLSCADHTFPKHP